MHTILVPTDFSPESELALLTACSIARDQECELIVLHVLRPDECTDADREDGELNRESNLYQSCCDRFSRLKAFARGVRVSFQVKIGHAVEAIQKVAQNECCDLIVIASRQKSDIHRQIYGSVAESLARRSPTLILWINQSPFLQKPRSMLDGLRQNLHDEAVFTNH